MSFQQGLSGLNAAGKNLDIIGNNVANANTFGAKYSRAEFSDVYANQINGTSYNAVGVGVTVSKVAQQFTQGSITTTSNPLDLAISGSGFFQVQAANGQTLYTRNGQFKLDPQGTIVNNEGQPLLGNRADSTGKIQGGSAQSLILPSQGQPPLATTKVTLGMNLDSRGVAPTAAFDPKNPATYNNATSVTMYDENGQEIALTYYFVKLPKTNPSDPAEPALWDLYGTANGSPIAGSGASGQITQLTFSPAGALTSPTTVQPFPVTVAATASATPVNVDLDVLGSTQWASKFAVNSLEQDGHAAGDLIGVAIDNEGTVRAQYSNGNNQALGQLELVNFRNPQGLQPMGGNAWSRTVNSGEALKGYAGSGTIGRIAPSALEESNVDLTGELVNMIVAQRIYQANAQTIKTQDQALQTLVNLR